MKPTILFLFNSSDYAPAPWLEHGGFNCVSVDYDDTDHSQAHRGPAEGHTVLNIDLSIPCARDSVVDSIWALGMAQPSLVVSFAPCTDLAVSGAAHFKKKAATNANFQYDAVRMARIAEQFDCPYMVENPVSVLATLWRKPDMYWHPYDFAYACPDGLHPEFPEVIPERDLYPKKTGMWCGNGFVMPQKVAVPSGIEIPTVNPGHAQLGGKSARTKYIRSLTPRGFSRAVFMCNCDNILSEVGTQTVSNSGILATQVTQKDVI